MSAKEAEKSPRPIDREKPYQRLCARRVVKNKAVVAVARELAGFVWAIGREVQTSGWPGVKAGSQISQEMRH